MTPKFSSKIKGFLLNHFLWHLLALLLVWVVSTDIQIWLLFLYAYLGIIVVVSIREVVLLWCRRRRTEYSLQAERLLLLVREMIDLAYTYENNPKKFYEKFREQVSASALEERGIIDPDTLLHTARYNRMCENLKREDAELWALLMRGFSIRELKVIYGFENINSVYTKTHRLRSRLDKRMQQLLDEFQPPPTRNSSREPEGYRKSRNKPAP